MGVGGLSGKVGGSWGGHSLAFGDHQRSPGLPGAGCGVEPSWSMVTPGCASLPSTSETPSAHPGWGRGAAPPSQPQPPHPLPTEVSVPGLRCPSPGLAMEAGAGRLNILRERSRGARAARNPNRCKAPAQWD